MATLQEQLDEAKARVAQLEATIKGEPCSRVGHRWKHIGGRNCGCLPGASCSIPVHECEVCGDCDYGENAEANEHIRKCAHEARAAGLEEERLAALEGEEE